VRLEEENSRRLFPFTGTTGDRRKWGKTKLLCFLILLSPFLNSYRALASSFPAHPVCHILSEFIPLWIPPLEPALGWPAWGASRQFPFVMTLHMSHWNLIEINDTSSNKLSRLCNRSKTLFQSKKWPKIAPRPSTFIVSHWFPQEICSNCK